MMSRLRRLAPGAVGRRPSAGFDTLHVRYQGRSVAVIDRNERRSWFFHPQLPLFVIDDTRWTNHQGALYLTIGHSTFAVIAESLANLLAVI